MSSTIRTILKPAQGQRAKGTMKTAQPGPGGKQSIKRLEARGGVIVIHKDQTATGETGHLRDEDQYRDPVGVAS